MLKSRFGHHANPATDFVCEVDQLGRMIADRRCGAAWHASLEPRVRTAMEYVVGGVPSAIEAKARLRRIDAELAQEAEAA